MQIGLNAVAILGGVSGEGSLGPYYARLFERWLSAEKAQRAAFVASFVTIIAVFLVFADLFPKRLGMNEPERLAVRMVGPMQVLITTFKPLVWLFTRSTDLLFKLLGMPAQRDDKITSADILAMTEAGAQAGVLAQREQQVIANVFELDTRLVSSVMTSRERIAWFLKDEPEAILRARIVAEPFSAYPVCDGDIDHVLGYVDAKDMFQRVLAGQPLALDQGLPLLKALVIPDRLTLTEVLEQFRQAREDFAIVVNEYSLVVGVITLNDVMSTVMGDLVRRSGRGAADRAPRRELLADRRRDADPGRAARARHRRAAARRGIRDPGRLPDDHVAARAQAHRQRHWGRLHLRGDRRRQPPHRPGHGDAQRRCGPPGA